jgi:hypothetical protein
MKKFVSIYLIIIATYSVKAQEMLGIVNGNYSGVSSYAINPSLMADSKLYMDINFLTTGVSYQTDMVKNAYGNFRLNGPSIMINRGEHAFAFIDAARTAISYKKTSSNNGSYTQYQVAGIAWGEIGLSYAKIFSRVEKSWWAGGLTLKYLMGAGGAFYENTSISNTGSSSSSTNISNSGVSSFGSGGMGFGKGAGIDIGVTYQQKENKENLMPFKKLCQQKYQPYKYKIGVSIVDFGFLKFSNKTKNSNFNQNMGKVDSVLVTVNDTSYYVKSDSINNSSNSSLYKKTYSVYLPAGFCVQFDYRISEHWFMNGTFVKGMNLSPEFVRRPTLIAFAPRYEKRWFEANLPISVSDMKYFRLGASVRFWNFLIGTDNLLGSFGVGTNKSFDVYISLKLNFQKGKCGRKKGGILEPFRQLFK